LKLKCGEPLSNVAFNVNLRRYSEGGLDRNGLTQMMRRQSMTGPKGGGGGDGPDMLLLGAATAVNARV
jgi:hypothetical protein